MTASEIPNVPGSGTLVLRSVLNEANLVAPTTWTAITDLHDADPALAEQILVAEIPPELADTQSLTEAYSMDPALSVNCIIVGGTRGGTERVAACAIRATTRADVNRTLRKTLDVRKASFLPQERAVSLTGMEYGGITPIGLPEEWRVLLDARVANPASWACIGSGLRRSKLFVTGRVLRALPGSEVIEGLAVEL